MSIERYRNDNPRDASDVADAIEAELVAVNASAATVPGTQNHAFIQSMATTLAEQQEESLNALYDAAYIADASGDELTKLCSEIGVDRQAAVEATGVALFSRDSPAVTDRVIQSGTPISTGGDDATRFETQEAATIDGPRTISNTDTYSTTSTTFGAEYTTTVDVEFMESLDVRADIRTTDQSHTTELEIVNTTNGEEIAAHSTSSETFVTVGPDSYDVTGFDGEITIEYQLRTTNAAATAELTDIDISLGGITAARADIMAAETGPAGNVGAETIYVLVEQPAGVESVTNPNPTGDPSHTLTDGTTPFTVGATLEDDESLRARALESSAIGGAGTAATAELALENVPDVISADVFTNRSDTTTNGVSPWHTEVRVYGGETQEIANILYDVLPLSTLKSLEGGVNGTLNTTTLTENDLYGDLDIPITRPTEVSLAIDIELVHDASYAGMAAVKNEIVQYIGGTTTDARSRPGIGQGENVIVNEVENVAEDVDGVDAVINTVIDDNDDGTDDTTTDSDGVQVYDVPSSDVAVVNADDITVTETAR